MRKVLMLPTPNQASNDLTNSIHQIVLKLRDSLPEFGYELTENKAQAELIVGHAGQTYSDTPVHIAHCHGLYPTAYPQLIEPWHISANQSVIHNLINAQFVTAPSQWVADILRRDMHLQPFVIPWGIDFSEWSPGENKGYVLWNKTRVDGVCNPTPMTELARKRSNLQFVGTFISNDQMGQPSSNVRVIGRQPYAVMQKYIQEAGVYLATTKETFGIGILEAMASGVPVLGYKHGSVTNIVQHGVTGYLVDPNDIDSLAEGLDYCLQHRAILGANARKIAAIYTWRNVARAIADVYDRYFETQELARAKVSVVIPCYNYEKYVVTAIESVKKQKTDFSVELIVVDDGSTDNSVAVARKATSDHVIGSEHIILKNGGVANARNAGIAASSGQYIVCLDADDQLLHPDFLQKLSESLDSDRGLGIAFTGLGMVAEDGTLGNASGWPNGFDFDAQLMRRNQVPTCCMFRREAWRRAGGYKAVYQPAEDAELWTRIISLGYRAKHAVDAPWFGYRLHSNSLSSSIREGKKAEPDWLGDKPWVADKQYPFAANGIARPVRNYDRPKVSIIIPVAGYHVMNLPVALDSVEQQTERYWECIVVNDTGEDLPTLIPFPWVKVVNTSGRLGAGAARNLGVQNASAKMITFLDADDILMPTFLEKVLKAYTRSGQYIYTDWMSLNKQGQLEPHETPDFIIGDVFKQPTRHSINVLLKKEWFDLTGGFDTTMRSWEDVELFMKLAEKGICGQRVPEPLLIYRYNTGKLREYGETIKPEIIKLLNERYGDYIQGRKMCSCANPGPGVQTKINGGPSVGPANTAAQLIRIQYSGAAGTHDVIGPISKKSYGRRSGGDTFLVYKKDQEAYPNLFMPIAEVLDERPTTVIPPMPVLAP